VYCFAQDNLFRSIFGYVGKYAMPQIQGAGLLGRAVFEMVLLPVGHVCVQFLGSDSL
jgi:hypothetical protein